MKETITATYRLQFNHQFRLCHASQLVDYWQELGITAIYASPLTEARKGSLYGYDVVNHNQINPEIGTKEELKKFSNELKKRGISLILDIVPNHMCIADKQNSWWYDVLENGPFSLYADYFDILWNPPKAELKDKILLPILSKQIGEVIENQELKIFYHGGAFYFDYQGKSLPINLKSWSAILTDASHTILSSLLPEDESYLEFQSILTALSHLPSSMEEGSKEKIWHYQCEKQVIQKRLCRLVEESSTFKKLLQNTIDTLNGKKGDCQSFDKLEEILKKQFYRLSYWRLCNDLINYRRFFEINDLACLHVENEKVFQAIHALVLELVQDGCLAGLRIDHIDGLYYPEGYLKRLRHQSDAAKKLYLIVEKILVGEEPLNRNWQIQGTSGYDYLNLVKGLFIKSSAAAFLQRTYDKFIGYHNPLKQTLQDCKRLILTVSMASELTTLARRLEIIGEQHRWSCDFSYESLRSALRDVIISFSVYRSYISPNEKIVSKQDRKVILNAIKSAKKLNPLSSHLVFDFIESVLLLKDPPGISEKQKLLRREFVLRFQQLTGPVMAKGVEDTALYRSFALSSNNEVGMDPTEFGITVAKFHLANQERQNSWPYSLLASSTHDTKRSEDVRARIHCLTEIAEKWERALLSWQVMNEEKKEWLHPSVPSANEEYLLYQTLIGSWPEAFLDAQDQMDYLKRIQEYMVKALREAKVNSSWLYPNLKYEEAVKKFIANLLDAKKSLLFLTDLEEFIQPIQQAGKWSSLSQTVIKIFSPGIADFYQGSEYFALTLVDPDNRQPVNFDERFKALRKLKERCKNEGSDFLLELKSQLGDDVKLFVIWRALNFRKEFPLLFSQGEYTPIIVEGKRASHLLAFKRTYQSQECLLITSRFFMAMVDKAKQLKESSFWSETSICLDLSADACWVDLFTHARFELKAGQKLFVKEIFTLFPFVMLVRKPLV